jgi:hypothetical protein
MKRELIAFSVLSAALATLGGAQVAEFPPSSQLDEKNEAIRSPLMEPFADNRDWALVRDLVYRVGESVVTITVPQGFVTDFASIPQAFWSFGLSPNGTYSRAAIVHDYLYWTQLCTRLQADNILMIAMKESQVPKGKRDLIYAGVRAGGDSAWDENAVEKRKGFPKFVPADREFGALVFWKDYRAKLRADGVKDPVPPRQTYCSIGNTTDVPGHPE